VRAVTGRAGERIQPFLARALTDGEVLPLHEASGERLQSALGAASKTRGVPAPLTLTRDDDTARAFAIVLPREAFPDGLAQAFQLGATWVEPLYAIVFLSSRDLRQAPEIAQQGLGLTAAEGRLTAKLKQGLALNDAAAELGISAHTARTQLKSIFAKTGVRRQSELVGMLTELASIAPAVGPTEAAGISIPPRRFMTLGDGRRLFYREYGVANGRPALYFHVGSGASVVMPAMAKAASEAKLRLIAFDRPGYGHSTPADVYTLESIASDVEALLDHLQLRSVAFVGDGNGGAFAVAAAARLRERVRCIALRAPRLRRTPAGAPGTLQSALSTLSRQPWAIKGVADLIHRSIHTSFLRSFMRRNAGFSAADLNNPDIEAFAAGFEAAVADAFELTGAGLAAELTLFASGVFADPAAVDCPIKIWHGAEHSGVPVSESLAAFDGHPRAEVIVLPKTGFYLPTPVMADICRFLAETPRHG
jgi:pimeloyl-ACP methyl ester carboxylesterase/DNA-binding CsgD family transcriptional regulator